MSKRAESVFILNKILLKTEYHSKIKLFGFNLSLNLRANRSVCFVSCNFESVVLPKLPFPSANTNSDFDHVTIFVFVYKSATSLQ